MHGYMYLFVYFLISVCLDSTYDVIDCLHRADPTERNGSQEFRNPETPESHPTAGVQRESTGHGELGNGFRPTLLSSERGILLDYYFSLRLLIFLK